LCFVTFSANSVGSYGSARVWSDCFLTVGWHRSPRVISDRNAYVGIRWLYVSRIQIGFRHYGSEYWSVPQCNLIEFYRFSWDSDRITIGIGGSPIWIISPGEVSSKFFFIRTRFINTDLNYHLWLEYRNLTFNRMMWALFWKHFHPILTSNPPVH
jgi:hypothetical protein